MRSRVARRAFPTLVIAVLAFTVSAVALTTGSGAIPADATYTPQPLQGPPGTTITASDPVGCITPTFNDEARLILWDPGFTTIYGQINTSSVSGAYQLSLPAPNLPAGTPIVVQLNCLGTGGAQGTSSPTFTLTAAIAPPAEVVAPADALTFAG